MRLCLNSYFNKNKKVFKKKKLENPFRDQIFEPSQPKNIIPPLHKFPPWMEGGGVSPGVLWLREKKRERENDRGVGGEDRVEKRKLRE